MKDFLLLLLLLFIIYLIAYFILSAIYALIPFLCIIAVVFGIFWIFRMIKKRKSIDLIIENNNECPAPEIPIVNHMTDSEFEEFMIECNEQMKRDDKKERALLCNEEKKTDCLLKAVIIPKSVDPLFEESGKLIIERNSAAIGVLQRSFRIGFNRAARIMDQLAACGVVGDEVGTKPREILASMEEFEYFIENYEYLYRSAESKRKPDGNPVFQKIQLYNNQYDYMEGHEFEYFCAQLLQENGFENVSVTPGSGDQGIDIIAYREGVKYGIQCKCYSSDIGNKAIQEVFSGAKFYDCHVPVVLTNRHFTDSAKELAKKINVLMWDREYLDKLIFAATPDKESNVTD